MFYSRWESEPRFSVRCFPRLVDSRDNICLPTNPISTKGPKETLTGLSSNNHTSTSLAQTVLVLQPNEPVSTTPDNITCLTDMISKREGQIVHRDPASLPLTIWMLAGKIALKEAALLRSEYVSMKCKGLS